MMKRIDYFIPTRIVFGAGRLKELATLSLPGKKALLCVTEDKLMEKLGIQQRVIELLGQNGVSVAVFDKVTPNPTRTGVMADSPVTPRVWSASWRPPRSPRKAAVTS